MTDDPSTNSGEWVCAHADTEPCGPEDWNDGRDAAATGCGYVTPSPVQDSERPDTAMLRADAEWIRRKFGAVEYTKADRLEESCDWIDAHRRPTPEGDVLAELRAMRANGKTYIVDILAAVDRLLARGGE